MSEPFVFDPRCDLCKTPFGAVVCGQEKRLRQGAFDQALELEPTSFVPDAPEDEETYRIVRSKSFSIKPMNREEAILQMNLLGHTFFAFRDEEAGGAFAVVYKRNDGDYGIIEDPAE